MLKEAAHRLYLGVNRALTPLGLTVDTRGRRALADHLHEEAVRELHDCFRLVVFPDMPERDGRVALLARLLGTGVSEALYIVRYLHRSLPGGGDVCEFGIAQGATSALLANEIRDTNRRLWLYDSFEGLSRPSDKDVLLDDISGLGSMASYEHAMAWGPGRVRRRLQEIGFPEQRVRIIPGYVDEEATARHLPDSVAFAYLDMDLYEPTLVALRLLDSRLHAGSHVVVDDYGFFSSGPKTAVDEFVRANPGRYEVHLPLEFAGHFCVVERRPE